MAYYSPSSVNIIRILYILYDIILVCYVAKIICAKENALYGGEVILKSIAVIKDRKD